MSKLIELLAVEILPNRVGYNADAYSTVQMIAPTAQSMTAELVAGWLGYSHKTTSQGSAAPYG